MVGRQCYTKVVNLGIENLVKFGISPDLIIGKVRTTGITERAKRYILQTVTGRADFSVNLKTTLKLHLVVDAKWSFK